MKITSLALTNRKNYETGGGRDEVQALCCKNLPRTHAETGHQLHPWGAREEGARKDLENSRKGDVESAKPC